MKKILILISILMLNLILFVNYGYATRYCNQSESLNPTISQDSIICYSGGPGASYCHVNSGVNIGDGVTGGCSVTCTAGYYACCGIKCECKPNMSNSN